jgi:hypothetical protein
MTTLTTKQCTVTERVLALRWWLVFFFFIAGLCLHLTIFKASHREGDEVIYLSLVEQLESGKGYTLHGSRLLEQGLVDRSQYDRPLFFHPPGGIALFWLFYRIFGFWGFPLVQLFCFALFFWSMMLLASKFEYSSSQVGLPVAAALAAFNPFAAHVMIKYWLDGPLLAFTTLAVALFFWSVRRPGVFWTIVAGVVLGYASLIKLTAFLVVPGAVLLCLPLIKLYGLAGMLRRVLMFVMPAVLVQLPWEAWQWLATGAPFPEWAGKPSASLIAKKTYIYFVTVVRSSLIYITWTPIIIWTIVPSLALCVVLWTHSRLRTNGLSLLAWIAVVIGFHMGLGFAGYSKVLRYIVLITPATILLASMALPAALERIGSGPFRGLLTKAFVAACLAAVVLEMATGVKAAFKVEAFFIFPLFRLW